MKKRALLGAAALGLLFLGAATWPQDPEPVSRQAAPPTFRDVLRGKVEQKCDTTLADGVWTLSFPAQAGGEDQGAVFFQILRAPWDPEMTDEELKQQTDRARAEARIKQQIDRAAAEARRSTLAAVGADFIQLREADGGDRYVPLGRVDLLINTPK